MEHGLRRYEAYQGLMLLLYISLCLLLAFPVANLFLIGHSSQPHISPAFKNYRYPSFWMQQSWINPDNALDYLIVYLVWAAIIFLVGRFVWLVLQIIGKYFIEGILREATSNVPKHSKPSLDILLSKPEKLFRTEFATLHANRFPHKYLFHAYQRLLLMLPGKTGGLSAENLLDKERRVVETDWQMFQNSWTPLRWLLWILPLLAFIKAILLLVAQSKPLMSSGSESQELLSNIGILLFGLVPILQVSLLSILLGLIHAIQKRTEMLYLSNLDSLFYEQLLSRLPFQSSDTLILLDALQRYFNEVHLALQRMEKMGSQKDTVQQ